MILLAIKHERKNKSNKLNVQQKEKQVKRWDFIIVPQMMGL
jgi:hypothetical protein